MTTSALSPLRRQYSCACSTWRTSATSSSPTTRTSRIGRSPEMPCGHRPGLTELVRRESSPDPPAASRRRRAPATRAARTAARRRSKSQMTQPALRVREGEREGARGRARVAVLLRERLRPSRDPTRCRWRNERRTDAPGTSLIRWRRLKIGSSTMPVVPDSARPSSAAGRVGVPAAAEEPRAIGLPFDRPLRPAFEAQDVHRPDGRLARDRAARRWQSSAALSARYSVSRNSLPNAGCARSSAGGARTISA